MHRRTAMKILSAAAAVPLMSRRLWAQQGEQALQMLPVLDATTGGRIELAASAGSTRFAGGAASQTIGYNGSYLGPLIRLARGEVPTVVENRLDEPITTHWHGLMVPGEFDGGPHSLIRPGGRWEVVLPIDQPPATIWYHSHVHGRTAPQVYSGLSGVLQVVDGEDDVRGLPTSYGTDDLMLVIQDRRFDAAGRMVYDPAMPDIMHGFSGDTILVNGQVGRTVSVPPGVVRLRLLNASNGRIYPLSMASGREMHLSATDAGYLDAPIALNAITLGPGERAEVLVDFAGAERDALVSEDNPNFGMMMRGMMMRGMMGRSGNTLGNRFEVLPFAVDARLDARIARIPDALGGSMPDLAGRAETTREVSLDMGMMGPGGMGGGMGGGMMGGRGMMGDGMMGRGRDRHGSQGTGTEIFGINGQPFDMERIDFTVPQGAVERWIVTASMMMHPFHIHGVAFEVVSEGGRPPQPQNRGWKDTVLVRDQVELVARFDQRADRVTPFMFHCHILEHEDGGMMGQFTVG